MIFSVRRLPRPFWLSSAAVVWSAVLVALAFTFPAYSSEVSSNSCDSAGHCTSTMVNSSSTLVEENGRGVLVVFGLLIALAVIGWIGLHFRCKLGSRVGLVIGWAAAIVVLAIGFVSFVLWIVVLPMAALMIVAAVETPTPAQKLQPQT